MAALQGGTDHGPTRASEAALYLPAGAILNRESPNEGFFYYTWQGMEGPRIPMRIQVSEVYTRVHPLLSNPQNLDLFLFYSGLEALSSILVVILETIPEFNRRSRYPPQLLVVGATRWRELVNENPDAHGRWSSVIGNKAGLSTTPLKVVVRPGMSEWPHSFFTLCMF